MFVTQKTIFLEKKIIFKKNNESKIQLEEVQELQTTIKDSVKIDTNS